MLNLTGNYIFQRIDIAVFGSDAVSTAIIVAQKSFDEIAQRLVENFYCSNYEGKTNTRTKYLSQSELQMFAVCPPSTKYAI